MGYVKEEENSFLDYQHLFIETSSGFIKWGFLSQNNFPNFLLDTGAHTICYQIYKSKKQVRTNPGIPKLE